jgi:hypothetical protein
MINIRLDVHERIRIFLTRKANRVATIPGPCRTADSMYIVFRVLRQIIIEHMAYVWDMQPASRDVGRDHHRELTLGELLQQTEPLLLWHIASQRLGIKAIAT